MINKSDVRKNKLSVRNSISFDSLAEKSKLIANKVIDYDYYNKADVILCYLAYGNEVKTDLIIEDALNKGKIVYLPKVSSDNLTMRFYRFNSYSDVSPGYKGILEPKGVTEEYIYNSDDNAAFMIVPGVAFDDNFYRVGYGKGFYDRYLSDKPLIYKCAVSFGCQLCNDCFHDANDIKMNCIISEDNCLYGSYQ